MKSAKTSNTPNIYYLSASMYVTNFLQTTANALWICNSLSMNVYLWMNFKYTLFGSFTDLTSGFFNNLLSRVISLNNIYSSMQAKQLAGD